MTMILAKSIRAAAALNIVQELQNYFAKKMRLAPDKGTFAPIEWLRNDGRHGGGTRLTYGGGNFFNRASLNISQVQYDDQPERPLASATAISSIVHPSHPRMPSIHLHLSWTEMKNGEGYWRIMADLNPSLPEVADQQRFTAAMQEAAGPHFNYGMEQGERYFYIPALQKHRGVAHFYLEQFRSGDDDQDRTYAMKFGKTMIDGYASILADKLPTLATPSAVDLNKQLAYHTLYLYQVLTLDRGTTSGLMVHDQNDIGILGSIPACVDRNLLASWVDLSPQPQDELVRAIVRALPADGRVEDSVKIEFCGILRRHYREHPEALDMQARGDKVPPTVGNHRG